MNIQSWDGEMLAMQMTNIVEKFSLFIGISEGLTIHNPFINAYILLFGSLFGIIAATIMAAYGLEHLVNEGHDWIARGYTTLMLISLTVNIFIIFGYIKGGLL